MRKPKAESRKQKEETFLLSDFGFLLYPVPMGTLRKILRRLFYTAAAVSTLLLLDTLILWPVSYNYFGKVEHVDYATPPKATNAFGFQRGRIYFLHQIAFFPKKAPSGGFHFSYGKDFPGAFDSWSYLTWNKRDGSDGVSTLGVRLLASFGVSAYHFFLLIPFSYLALLFALLPALAFRAIRRRRRSLARVGLCAKCGYDLRAHGPGDKCPECGTPVKG